MNHSFKADEIDEAEACPDEISIDEDEQGDEDIDICNIILRYYIYLVFENFLENHYNGSVRVSTCSNYLFPFKKTKLL